MRLREALRSKNYRSYILGIFLLNGCAQENPAPQPGSTSGSSTHESSSSGQLMLPTTGNSSSSSSSTSSGGISDSMSGSTGFMSTSTGGNTEGLMSTLTGTTNTEPPPLPFDICTNPEIDPTEAQITVKECRECLAPLLEIEENYCDTTYKLCFPESMADTMRLDTDGQLPSCQDALCCLAQLPSAECENRTGGPSDGAFQLLECAKRTIPGGCITECMPNG